MVNRFNLFIEMHFELVGDGHPAVIFQRFCAGRFRTIGNKRYSPDFQPLRCREERHVSGIVIKGIDQRAFFKNAIIYAGLFCFDGAGQANGAATYDNDTVLYGLISQRTNFCKCKAKTASGAKYTLHPVLSCEQWRSLCPIFTPLFFENESTKIML
jgi:hypothetical protein